MPSSAAVLVCFVSILWLVGKYARGRSASFALWIPTTWAFINASKPISIWLGLGAEVEFRSAGPEESPFDRNVFLVLIISGLFILWKRRVSWREAFASNQALFIYFLYLGLSVIWSDYSFVSFKRWIKDFGTVIMVLVVLSENDPVEAMKLVLARICYMLVPASLLMVRYYYIFGGAYYDRFTGQPHYIGVAQDKNMWGMTLFICGVFVAWRLMQPRSAVSRLANRIDLLAHSVLALILVYLFYKAHSTTALISAILGAGIIVGVKYPIIRNRINRLGFYSFALALSVMVLHLTVNLGAVVVGLVGEDLTFTGRFGIWESVLKEDVNPLLGDGFYSFWTPERNERLSEGFYYLLGVAHNGYIETYLNNGLIGVFLLLRMISANAKRIKWAALKDEELGTLRLAFLITIVIYNVTESVFDRLVYPWFTLLLVMIELPKRKTPEKNQQQEGSQSSLQMCPAT